MKEKRLLYAIGWVKDEYIEEMLDPAMEREYRRVPRKKLWLIAAVIAALLLTGCAAVILMRLENLALRQEVWTENSQETARVYTQISLQGFAGSPNYMAAKEWSDFLKDYDPDLSIWQSQSKEERDAWEEYIEYSCYTQEMADKIDEICDKYGLQKQSLPLLDQTMENVLRLLQMQSITVSNPEIQVLWNSGYIFKSGTFMMEGDVEFGDGTVGFQFGCVSKTDFDDVYLNIGEIEEYEQWSSVSADGGEVLLAVCPEKALIFADREGFFASVNFIIYDREITREELQNIAAMFDFSFSIHPVSEEDWEYLGSHKKESERPPLGTYPGGTFDEHVRLQLENNPNADTLEYALMDVDGIGGDELLIGKDGFVRAVFAADEQNTYVTPFVYIGFDLKETMFGDSGVVFLPSYGQICEGKKALYVFELTDETTVYMIAEVVNGRLDMTTMLQKDPGQNRYFMWKGIGVELTWAEKEEITKAEFDEILSACVPIDVPMMPLTEYPLR